MPNKAIQNIRAAANKNPQQIEELLAELLNVYEESAATEKEEKKVVDEAREAMLDLMKRAGLREHQVGTRVIRVIPEGKPGESVDYEKFIALLEGVRVFHPDIAQAFRACIKQTKPRAAYAKVENVK